MMVDKKPISRRLFLKECSKLGLGLMASGIHHIGLPQRAHARTVKWGFIGLKLSPYYIPLEEGNIKCVLCPKECTVSPGKRGYCEVRENRDGKYYSLVYGNPCAVHVDPIEKKPFFHVLPGTGSFSIATAGCNFDCKFCQNWEISQSRPEDTPNDELPPEKVVRQATSYGCQSIASTYVEPTIFYEYMHDIGRLVKGTGILNVCHSNGYINPEPLKNLCKYLDAACIDLKSFSETFYHEMCEGTLTPVLNTLKTLRQEGIHTEIVNLIIPTKNDDMQMIEAMCRWINKELGSDTPIHFTRFYPLYKLKNLPPTPVSTLEKARKMAKSVGLEYVYIGNVPGHESENTYCPHCKELLIKRIGYRISELNMKGGKCRSCGKQIPGIWNKYGKTND
jgi:pyruvate formate lyase activating enzyme